MRVGGWVAFGVVARRDRLYVRDGKRGLSAGAVEILADEQGRVQKIWASRKCLLVAPFPSFMVRLLVNQAVADMFSHHILELDSMHQ